MVFAKQNQPAPGVYASVDEMLNLRHYCQSLSLDTKKRSTALLDGDSKTSFRGRGMDFAEVRPYQAGDDIRTIDWRVTARTQKPYTKLYQEERERPVFVLVDQRSPMFFGSQNQFKSVLATKLCAAIGWISLANNDRIGALIFSDNKQSDSRAKRGKHSQLALVNLLSQYNHSLESPFPASGMIKMETMLTELRRVAKPGSSIYVISDFHDFNDKCSEPLAVLSRHTDVTLLRVYDQLEKELPQTPNLMVTNGAVKTNLSLLSSQFEEQFAQSFTQQTEYIRSSCMKLGVGLGHLPTHMQAEDIVQELFASSKQGRRGAPKSNPFSATQNSGKGGK